MYNCRISSTEELVASRHLDVWNHTKLSVIYNAGDVVNQYAPIPDKHKIDEHTRSKRERITKSLAAAD